MSTSVEGRVMAGRFRLGRMLGEGGMGTVYDAVDLTLERPIALKVLRAGLASDAQQLARFEREARAAARLAHPNVVGVTELVRDEAMGLGLVMELLSGESLEARLERGPLSDAEAVNVLMQALDGLAAAHAAGMIHRDLKPSNLFLVPIARGFLVKVLDFGIVKLAEDGPLPKLTRQGTLIGTPTYMSPEQLACEAVDARSDIYSMGACLYEALVARPPYVGNHSLELIAMVGAGPPIDLREVSHGVSPDLAHVTRVAMSRDPRGRYQSAEAMRDALRTIDTAPKPSNPAITERPRRMRAWAIALSAIAVLAVSVGWLAYGALRRSEAPRASVLVSPRATVLVTPDASPARVVELPPGLDPPELVVDPPRAHRPERARSHGGEEAPPETRTGIGETVLDPFAR